jgi:signal transduction histidine kinase
MRQRPWLVLLGGFGGLLLLMAAAEGSALLVLSSLRDNDSRLQQHFLVRNRTLEQIRSAIYLSGTYARDSLLAPEPSGSRAQIAALDSLHREAEGSLDRYAMSLESEEVGPFLSLRREIDSYWRVLDKTFAWSQEERARYRYEFFYNELIPRRTSMLQIADRVAQLNEQALQRGSRQLSSLFERLQLGLIAMVAITLLGGAALAGSTSFEILRLQGMARKRLEETAEARAGLRELSARLVRAQEDERRALSRELHDEAGQAFSAILMEAENLLDMQAPDLCGGVPHARLESIRDLASKGVNETRNMALLLRPSMLDDFGLLPALNWQAKETSRRTGLRVQVNAIDIEGDLGEEHKTCIYRVVQEALNNSARHAQASVVQIAVRGGPGNILLTVQDDGSGFDAHRIRGLGLLGMEERVRHLGGTFHIDSQPGRGTSLKVELPVASLLAGTSNGHHSHHSG